jgi:hypothetical protein
MYTSANPVHPYDPIVYKIPARPTLAGWKAQEFAHALSALSTQTRAGTRADLSLSDVALVAVADGETRRSCGRVA